MRKSLVLLILCAFAGAWPRPAAPAGTQQLDPRRVLLFNLIREASEIRVFERDQANPEKWKTSPRLKLKRTVDRELFRGLREADTGKPLDLRLPDATHRFDFKVRDAMHQVASDGRVLNRNGDASVVLPASWVSRL